MDETSGQTNQMLFRSQFAFFFVFLKAETEGEDSKRFREAGIWFHK